MKCRAWALIAGLTIAAAACGSSGGGTVPGGEGASTSSPATAGTLPAAPGGIDKLPLGDRPDSPPVDVDPSRTYLVDALHTAFTLKPPAARLSVTADLEGHAHVRFGPAEGGVAHFMVLDAAQVRVFDDPYVPGSERNTSEKLIGRTSPLPTDVTNWMAARPYVKDPVIRPVSIGGLTGTEVEYTLDLPADGSSCTTSGPRCALVFAVSANGFTPSLGEMNPPVRRRLTVLHGPAGDLIIVNNNTPEAASAIASITFHRPPTAVAGSVTSTTLTGVPGGRPVTDGLTLKAGETYVVDRTNFATAFSVVAPADGFEFGTRVGAAAISRPTGETDGLFLVDYSGTMRAFRDPLQDHSAFASQPDFDAASVAAPEDPLAHLKSFPFVEVIEDIHDGTAGGYPAHLLRFRVTSLGPKAPACHDRPQRCAEVWISTVGYASSYAEGDVVTALWLDLRGRRLYLEAGGPSGNAWLSSLKFLDE